MTVKAFTICELCGTEIEERYAYAAIIIPDKMKHLYRWFEGRPPCPYGIGKAVVGHLGYSLVPERGRFERYDSAQKEAEDLNRNLGLSDEEAILIILGTMAKGGVAHE